MDPITTYIPSAGGSPSKRTASEAGMNLNNNNNQPKTVKRRAPQACESCRARKVRCNVAKHGMPCSNCSLDEINCVVGENRRKKKKTANRTLPVASNNGISLSTDLQEVSQDASEVTTLQQAAAAPQLHGDIASNSALQSALPAYIKPLPDRFEADDITYLRNKGALAIPELELRNELLRCYIKYTHSFMPFLDWNNFLHIIERNDGTESISLLLFQAVMFAAVATVDPHLLQAAGFITRREARRAFFTKTRLLYDLDYEDDSITLIQALLLMTYWRENPNGRKETHHWIEIAVSLSRKIGLHRHQKEINAVDPERDKLRKRIWWSVYMRDVEIALGTRRSTLIKDLDFNTPMLQLEDFHFRAIHDASSISGGCETLRNDEIQRELATLCVEKARLCLCISHMLSLQFNATNTKGGSRTASMIFEAPLRPGGDQVQATAQALQAWEDALPNPAQRSTPTSHETESGDMCLLLNRSFLHLLYSATLFTLHRSRLLPSTTVPAHRILVDESRKAIRTAATKITTIAGTLQNLKLVQYLPSPTITLLLPAIVVHLQGVLSLDNSVRRRTLQDYCKCMQVMADLRDMYAAADYSTAFLQAAIQRTEIGPITLQSNVDKEATEVLTNTHVGQGTEASVEPSGSGLNTNGLASWPTVQQINDVPASSDQMTTAGPEGQVHHSAFSTMPETNISSGNLFDNQRFIQPTQLTPPRFQSHAADTTNDASPTNQTVSDGMTTTDLGNDIEDDYTASARERIFESNSGDLSMMNDLGDEVFFDGDWLMGIDPEGLMLVEGD